MCVHTGARFERRAVSRERSRDHRHRIRVAGLLEQGDRCSERRPDCLQVTADRSRPPSQGMDGTTEQATQFFFFNSYVPMPNGHCWPYISRYYYDICCSLQDSCHPVMTTYKLVTMDAPIWGLGERLEDCIIAVRTPPC